jgi:hypothetical protein
MLIRRLPVVVAPVAAVLAMAGPALGSSEGGAGGVLHGAPASRSATHSSTFAGWETTGPSSAGATITSTIVLPKLKCGAEPHAIDANVGAYYRANFKSFSAAGMFVGCNEGKVHYFPAFTLNGQNQTFRKLKAHAGDTILLKASLQSTGTTLSVVDKTTKRVHKKLTGKGVPKVLAPWAGDSSWVNAGEGGLEPVPNFGTLTFSNTRLDGAPFGLAAPTQYDRYKHSTLQISTSDFQSDHATFDTVFHHS